MARIIEALSQYSDDKGSPLDYGKLNFYASGTSNRKDTFSDLSETSANTNPVILDGEGRCPDVFGTGSYKVVLTDKNDVQIDEFDPIGDIGGLIPFSDWNDEITYPEFAIVMGSDGNYYISLQNGNLNNDPTLNPGSNQYWEEVRFLGVYNAQITYDEGVVVQTSDGKLWRSTASSNNGNNPSTDDGSNWKIAVAEFYYYKDSSFSATPDTYTIHATSAAVDATLTASASVGERWIFTVSSQSTQTVRIVNNGYTIYGKNGSATTSDNIVLSSGVMRVLICRAANVLEIY